MKLKKLLIPVTVFSLLLPLQLPGIANATVGPASGRMYLELCKSETDSDCIESVGFATPAQDYGLMNPTDTYLGPSNVVYFYKLPGYKGADGGDTVRVEARIDNGGVLFAEAGGSLVKVPNPRPKICDSDPQANSVCNVVGDLNLDLKISMVIRLNGLKPGVSNGALDDMNVKVSSAPYGTKLEISGKPIRYMGYIRYTGMPNWNNLSQNPTGDYVAGRWHFALFDQSKSPFGACNSAGAAFVQSNAEASNTPTWNSQFKSLDMQTASSHFEPDGVTPFKGIYSARLSADLVKCAWGIDASKAQRVAQIQIVSNSGDSSVASVSSNYQDGWLSLDARNYEYSNPIIRVRMQDSTQPQVKTFTITCVKGKSSKSVTAVKPTCPTGYKKK